MTTDVIKLEGVSVEQLQLLSDKCLVKPLGREEVRASGLFLLHGSLETSVGSEFYAEVVKVGPGVLVQEGPTPEATALFVLSVLMSLTNVEEAPALLPGEAERAMKEVHEFMEKRRPMRRVPPPWKAGDRVLVKQGFGVEVDLREGRHHVIERAGEYGHGILAAWDADHTHCWHEWDRLKDGSRIIVHCACGAERVVGVDFETRLPACASCPSGERLAEAVLGGKHVYDMKLPSMTAAREFDPERPGGFSAGELRPE